MTDTNESPADAAPSDSGVDASPAWPTAQAPVDVAPAGEAQADSIVDLDLPAGMQQFDRSYVEKLRAEAAANRTLAQERAAQLERFSAFDGYDDTDMSIWTKMASDWKAGDYTSAATMMQEIANNVLADPNATAAEKADAEDVLANPDAAAQTLAQAELTPDEIRRIAREEAELSDQERTAQQKLDADVALVWKQIGDAGYEEGSADAFAVLWYANNATDGDVAKALEMKRADEQKVIDNYVQGLAKGGSPVRLPSAGSPGREVSEPPRTFAESRQRAEAYLAEQQRHSG